MGSPFSDSSLFKDNDFICRRNGAAPGMTKDDFKVNIDEDDNLVVALEKETSANNDKSDRKSQRIA